MLNSLSSFLFKNEPSQDDLNSSVGAMVSTYDMQELDGDWLLVDPVGTSTDLLESSTTSGRSSFDLSNPEETGTFTSLNIEGEPEEEEGELAARHSVKLNLQASLLGPLDNQMSPPSSPNSQQMMDGSWYVTPPPCFTAGSPGYLETSPLENLLIEHPSMSVYGPISSNYSFLNMRRSESPFAGCYSRCSSVESLQKEEIVVVVSSDSSEEIENSPPLARRSPAENPQATGRRNHFGRSQSATLDAVALEERLLSIQAHKVQYRQDQRKLKSSTMERQNRTRLHKSSKGKSQRKNMYLMQPSNKSRKC